MVVGYQEFAVNDGYGMTTVTFAPISGSTIELQSLIPSGAGVGGYGDIVIQTMDADGNWAGEYSWWTEENSGLADGWYDVDFNLAEVALNYKQGVMVQAGEDVVLTYSGAVATGTIETDAPNGYSMSGNATPVALNIQSITPVGDGVGGYGDIVIQTMDADGNWAGEYSWWTEENSGLENGWYDVDFNYADVSINPGEGYMLQASADDVKLTYPGAL